MCVVPVYYVLLYCTRTQHCYTHTQTKNNKDLGKGTRGKLDKYNTTKYKYGNLIFYGGLWVYCIHTHDIHYMYYVLCTMYCMYECMCTTVVWDIKKTENKSLMLKI